MNTQDKSWPFVIATLIFWSSVMAILFFTNSVLILMITAPPLLYVLACIALFVGIYNDPILEKIPLHKKLCFSCCCLLYYINRFRYWLLKDMLIPENMTYEQFLREKL